MQVKWIKSGEDSFTIANLKVTGTDQLGIIGNITSLIANDLHVNMRSVNFGSKGKSFTGNLSVLVKDNDHLQQLIAKINKVEGVEKVARVK